jgi:hypothetical protein
LAAVDGAETDDLAEARRLDPTSGDQGRAAPDEKRRLGGSGELSQLAGGQHRVGEDDRGSETENSKIGSDLFQPDLREQHDPVPAGHAEIEEPVCYKTGRVVELTV